MEPGLRAYICIYLLDSKSCGHYCTLNPLSPDLIEMSECSTPETDAAEGPLFRCWTNSLIASSLPCASPWTCIASALGTIWGHDGTYTAIGCIGDEASDSNALCLLLGE
jgi:hypothetical protein